MAHQLAWKRYDELPNRSRSFAPPDTPERRAKWIAERGLGSHHEIQVCTACGKQGLDWRAVCHCGAVMEVEGVRGWRKQYAQKTCGACGYNPDWNALVLNKGGAMPRWVPNPIARPKCQCELKKRSAA